MIINLEKFIAEEQPVWTELEKVLTRLENDMAARLDLDGAKRFHYLYQRTATGLSQIQTFASEPGLHRYLETLVARAYAEIHETRAHPHSFRLLHWLGVVFPQTFRRHLGAFWLSLGITLLGASFGAGALLLDPNAKEVLMPFSHLLGDPAERVAREEAGTDDHLGGAHASFSSMLMTHNTRVAVLIFALGITWGLGSFVVLFYNGVILGAVLADYIAAGQSRFLAGWLLPHGSIEIPAILMAGQAGLMVGHALLARGERARLRQRFRSLAPDLVTLLAGVALLLIWAGLVESFMSQYHEPILPYSIKIAFGLAELAVLFLYLGRAGRPTHS